MTGANQGAMLERLPSVPSIGEAMPWSRPWTRGSFSHTLAWSCSLPGAVSVTDIRSGLAVDEVQGRDDLFLLQQAKKLGCEPSLV